MPSMRNFVKICAATSLLAACAQKSDEISATYVSPNEYSGYSCNQLRDEAARISSKASASMSKQDKAAENDGAAVAVGAILFWPALFLIKGDNATATEVAELKGRMEAIERVNAAKKCGIKFAPA